MKPITQLFGLIVEDILAVLGETAELERYKNELLKLQVFMYDLDIYSKKKEQMSAKFVKLHLFQKILNQIALPKPPRAVPVAKKPVKRITKGMKAAAAAAADTIMVITQSAETEAATAAAVVHLQPVKKTRKKAATNVTVDKAATSSSTSAAAAAVESIKTTDEPKVPRRRKKTTPASESTLPTTTIA